MPIESLPEVDADELRDGGLFIDYEPEYYYPMPPQTLSLKKKRNILFAVIGLSMFAITFAIWIYLLIIMCQV